MSYSTEVILNSLLAQYFKLEEPAQSLSDDQKAALFLR
jgi:hypothetical protein